MLIALFLLIVILSGPCIVLFQTQNLDMTAIIQASIFTLIILVIAYLSKFFDSILILIRGDFLVFDNDLKIIRKNKKQLTHFNNIKCIEVIKTHYKGESYDSYYLVLKNTKRIQLLDYELDDKLKDYITSILNIKIERKTSLCPYTYEIKNDNSICIKEKALNLLFLPFLITFLIGPWIFVYSLKNQLNLIQVFLLLGYSCFYSYIVFKSNLIVLMFVGWYIDFNAKKKSVLVNGKVLAEFSNIKSIKTFYIKFNNEKRNFETFLLLKNGKKIKLYDDKLEADILEKITLLTNIKVEYEEEE